MHSIHHLVLAGFVTFAMAVGAETDNPQESPRSNYPLKITRQREDRVDGYWHLGALTNAAPIDDYLRALSDECKKYPVNFFSKASVSEIILCGDLNMGTAPITGFFSAQEEKLYLKYHWCQQGARCRTSFHAFHHELGHALQTAVWGDGHYAWREWAAVNPPGFHYGSGGNRDLMADPEKRWGSWTTNQPGFLNAYSTTAAWEDRSEIMAALMNDGERPLLRNYCQRDPVLQKKAGLMANLLSEFCGSSTTKYFWEQSLASLRTQAEIPAQANSPTSNLTGPAIMADLPGVLGDDLIDAGGNAVSFESLKDKKYFLLYFSAAWCSRCREFMPKFLEFYRKTPFRNKFEVLFISADRDEPAMREYLHEMPWKAVRFSSAAATFLKAHYSRSSGIPTLALIDSDGQLLAVRKGFAKNFPHGVDEMLAIFNQRLQDNK